MRIYLQRKCLLGFSEQLSNKIYTLSSKIGGESADGLYERYANKYHNHAIYEFKRQLLSGKQGASNEFYVPGATVVTTAQECLRCMEVLMKSNTIAAWDTETMDLDIKNEAPVGKGKIICASFFAGPQYNFGNGPRVFIDNFGKNAGLILHFKEYLQSQSHKKVWHNYGFDRHLFYNHGINVRGFGGDTMHMARLYDSGKMFRQYSLSALTKDYAEDIKSVAKAYVEKQKQNIDQRLEKEQDEGEKNKLEETINNLNIYTQVQATVSSLAKIKMEDIFKRRKILKSGGEGVSYEYPTTLTLHTNIEYMRRWVEYSLLDSESTFFLRETLQSLLDKEKSTAYPGMDNMWKLYEKYWLPFGQVLTDMQRIGFKIDCQHMKNIEEQAQLKMKQKKDEFLLLLLQFQDDPNIQLFNPSSSLQLQQFIHAPYKVVTPAKRLNNLDYTDDELNLIRESQMSDDEVGFIKKNVRKPTTLDEEFKTFKVDNPDPVKGNKKIDMVVKGYGLPAQKTTPLGLPSVDESVLQILAGSPKTGKYGKAFDHFKNKGDPQAGKRFCELLQVLIEFNSLETLVQTFILPLRGYTDANERIHCSLNINTQTGRLSARKPNLQNQPALEKDIYKIRKAFIADKGKKLIVSDYGQLELRVLAHLTDCKAMIKAFAEGGDFHSRTAISMYDYIRKDLETGAVLLEWDKSKGTPPVPLLKDKYASERKKAKTVNFSIAYGKSARGFSQDWSCSLKQAQNVIKAWFSDRPQVKKWQEIKQEIAEKKKYTQTLLGRFRKLDRLFEGPQSKKGLLKGMRERRAINTPIQGGAADIVIAAMVNISRNQRLTDLGWKLILQIHDELILQGPQESAVQALQIVKQEMEHPFERELLVALQVDAKIVDNWAAAK